MKLFLVSQDQNNDYDTFDSFVIACETEEEAKNSHPYGNAMTQEDWDYEYSTWCNSVDHVSVKYLGEADSGVAKGIVCSSFRAG